MAETDMIFGKPTTTARFLQSGNDDLTFKSPLGPMLPSRDALMERLDTYFYDQGGIAGLPMSLRTDVNWLIDQMYGGTSGLDKRAVVVGSVESVVIPDGSRPVLFVQNDGLVTKGKPDGPFVFALQQRESMLETSALSIGRIETDDFPAPAGSDVYYEGTGFLVASDLIMTNRHVVENMVYEQFTDGPFTLKANYWINFDGQLGGGFGRRIKITDVAHVSEGHVGTSANFGLFDMALLRLGAPQQAAFANPPLLRLSARQLSKETKVAVIGFPAAPRVYAGTEAPPAGYELETIMRTVFDERFGYKRCASGRISTPAGASANDPKKWILAHDASTLSGNSGSPLIPLDRDHAEVAALHFLGSPRKANYAYVFDQMATTLADFGIQLH